VPEVELTIGDLHINLLMRTVRRAGIEIELLPREYQLLEHLVRNAGSIMTRTMIFEQVWGYHLDERTNVIDVHIAKLRRKLEAGGGPAMIETVRGAGYRFVAA
jgi:DNA-binding response OmpR family regulator